MHPSSRAGDSLMLSLLHIGDICRPLLFSLQPLFTMGEMRMKSSLLVSHRTQEVTNIKSIALNPKGTRELFFLQPNLSDYGPGTQS